MTIRQCAGLHCAAARRTHEYFVPFAEFWRRSGNLFPGEILRAAERGRHGEERGLREEIGAGKFVGRSFAGRARNPAVLGAVSRRGGVRDLRIPMRTRGKKGRRGRGRERERLGG